VRTNERNGATQDFMKRGARYARAARIGGGSYGLRFSSFSFPPFNSRA